MSAAPQMRIDLSPTFLDPSCVGMMELSNRIGSIAPKDGAGESQPDPTPKTERMRIDSATAVRSHCRYESGAGTFPLSLFGRSASSRLF